jgi:hypothetical protein
VRASAQCSGGALLFEEAIPSRKAFFKALYPANIAKKIIRYSSSWPFILKIGVRAEKIRPETAFAGYRSNI